MKLRSIAILALIALGSLASCSDNPEAALRPATTIDAVSDAAASPAGSADPQTDLPSGYVLHDGVEDGFEIALPDDWTIFGQADIDVDQLMSGVDGSSFADIQDQITSLFEQGGVLMAFDFERGSAEFVDNINILRTPPTPLTASGLAKLAAEQFESFGAINISTEVQVLPAGETAVVRYQLPEFGSAGISYTIVADERNWSITISARDLESMSIDPEIVANSFRLLPQP